MRIALVTDGIWPYVLGGMQKHSYYLCKYFAANKVEVDLFHFNQSAYDISKLEFFSEEEKKHIRSITVDFPDGDRLPGHYIRRSRQHSKMVFEAIKDQLSTYDFIYTKGFTGWYLIDQKKAGNINCAKIGVKFHGYEMFQKPPSFTALLQYVFLLRKPVKHISRNADVVFSYGGKITDIIRQIGVKEERIFVMPSGVEASLAVTAIKPVSGKLKFLFLGRYERRKGVEELNNAIQQLENDNCEFHFIGPIPEEKKLKKVNVVYYGEIRDRELLQEKMRNCDVLICPSWSEGMPNVILEAMANGLAVIATDVGATNVLVGERTGWLLYSSDPKEIKAMLVKVMSEPPSQIASKKQNALDLIRTDLTWEKLSASFLEHLKQLL